MKRFGFTLTILVASFGASACSDGLDDTDDGTPPPGSTSGGDDNTFDHENDGFDPFAVIDRLDKEGPPKFRSFMHGCMKLHVATLGNVLTSVGVNLALNTDGSAGKLFREGANALGGPNFANRIRENAGITTSGASREFDIFAAGAQEIIDNVPSLARCKVNNVGAQIFDPTTNACRADGITCITGVPATAAHLDFCNIAVSTASSLATGKRLAVAAIMAAAFTCE